MSDTIPWLPSLVLFDAYRGNWEIYLEILYNIFKSDFIEHPPLFQGRKIGLKRYPLTSNKEVTFWHMISTGNRETERIPDLRRCERIKWPKSILEHHSDCNIKIWKNKRGREERICVWLVPENYLVVLADRKNYLLLWTAYVVDKPHRQEKLLKEFQRYWRDNPFKG